MLVVDGVLCFTWMGVSPFTLKHQLVTLYVSLYLHYEVNIAATNETTFINPLPVSAQGDNDVEWTLLRRQKVKNEVVTTSFSHRAPAGLVHFLFRLLIPVHVLFFRKTSKKTRLKPITFIGAIANTNHNLFLPL